MDWYLVAKYLIRSHASESYSLNIGQRISEIFCTFAVLWQIKLL